MDDERPWNDWCSHVPPTQQPLWYKPSSKARNVDPQDRARIEMFGLAKPPNNMPPNQPGRWGKRSNIHVLSPAVDAGASGNSTEARREDGLSIAAGAPATFGRRRNPELSAYFDGTVVNMHKNYDEMTQRAAGRLEHMGGGVQVIYGGQRDKTMEYAPPHRVSALDTELFPPPTVASHPTDCCSPVREAYFGRPRTDVRGEPGGPGWDDGHLSMGPTGTDHPMDRPSFGRMRQLTAHMDKVVLNNLSYQPPPGPDRGWKRGEPPVPRFDFKDAGRAGLFPRISSDVTTFDKREQRNCSVLGNDNDASVPRGATDVTDIRAYERHRERLAQPLVGHNPGAGNVNTGGGLFCALPDNEAWLGTGAARRNRAVGL